MFLNTIMRWVGHFQEYWEVREEMGGIKKIALNKITL